MNAAAATQQMLDLFDITGIVHFGIAGNANDSLSIGDVTIPRQLAQTGLWDWLVIGILCCDFDQHLFVFYVQTDLLCEQNPNSTPNDAAVLEIERYNVPEGGSNQLGRIGYSTEMLYSKSAGNPNTVQRTLWFNTTKHWLQLASNLQV